MEPIWKAFSIGLLSGLFIGTVISLFILSICKAAGKADDQALQPNDLAYDLIQQARSNEAQRTKEIAARIEKGIL